VKNYSAVNKPTIRRTLPLACIAVLPMAFTAAMAEPLRVERVWPPRVPTDIQVPAGNKAFLEGHATGTQNYVCLPSNNGFAWTFFAPQATLFNDNDKQITTHFLSPNPFEGGTLRATWQHSQDTSAVWGSTIQMSSDPRFVKPGAIPWLLLQVVGAQDGPNYGDKLNPIRPTYIHRVNTVGGTAPATGCAAASDVGKKLFVPYKADYFFYKYRGFGDDDDY